MKIAIDFGSVEGVVHNPDFISSIFMDDELVLVCGNNHYLYNSRSISLNESTGIDFVVRDLGSGTRELFDSVMAANDIDWTVKWECNGSDE